ISAGRSETPGSPAAAAAAIRLRTQPAWCFQQFISTGGGRSVRSGVGEGEAITGGMPGPSEGKGVTRREFAELLLPYQGNSLTLWERGWCVGPPVGQRVTREGHGDRPAGSRMWVTRSASDHCWRW